MITYNGQELFSSGPSRLEPGSVEGRDAIAGSPGSVGASIIGQGRQPRTLKQHGTLVADSASDLNALVDAIDSEVGAGAAVLRDDRSNDWPGCVLRVFEPTRFFRLGPRYAADYTLTYLQTTP